MTEPTDDMRFCEDCDSVKPLSEFRRRSPEAPVRLNQCRACHNLAERVRRARKGTRREHWLMAKWLTQVANERDNDRLVLLSAVMFRQFGGFQGFVAAWVRYHRRAMQEGGLAAVRCFVAFFRLLGYCESTQPAPSELADDELERSLL